MNKNVLNYKNFVYLKESLSNAKKKYEDKIEPKIFKKFIDIDKTKTKKYLEWMCKQYLNDNTVLDKMNSLITEFDTLVNKHKIQKDDKDINKYKTFEDLEKKIEEINNKRSFSLSEYEKKYTVIVNDKNVFVVRPDTHEAARKLGFTTFNHRENNETNTSDCTWCITYADDTHFNDYYLNQRKTFYLIDIKENGKYFKDISKLEYNDKCLYRKVYGNLKCQFAMEMSDTGSYTLWDSYDRDLNSDLADLIIGYYLADYGFVKPKHTEDEYKNIIKIYKNNKC